jgi:hypothetical protein
MTLTSTPRLGVKFTIGAIMLADVRLQGSSFASAIVQPLVLC